MTISNITPTVTYQGNGVTTTFSFSFVADSASDISVTYTDSSGNATVLPSNQYTLVINAPAAGQLWGVGGSVTYPITSPVTPIQSGTSLTITRMVPYEQDTTLNNQGAFYPTVVEQGLDNLELQIQQIVSDLAYAIQVPVSDGTPPNVLPGKVARANLYLGFDANGQPIATSVTTSGSSSTATVRTVSTSGTATINVLTSDSFGGVSIHQTGGSNSTTIQLPSTGGPYPVFDGSGNAGSFPLTVLPASGTIDGKSSFVLSYNNQSVSFCLGDGTRVLVN